MNDKIRQKQSERMIHMAWAMLQRAEKYASLDDKEQIINARCSIEKLPHVKSVIDRQQKMRVG